MCTHICIWRHPAVHADLQVCGAEERFLAESGMSSQESRLMGRTCLTSSVSGCIAGAHTRRPLQQTQRAEVIICLPAAFIPVGTGSQHQPRRKNQAPHKRLCREHDLPSAFQTAGNLCNNGRVIPLGLAFVC